MTRPVQSPFFKSALYWYPLLTEAGAPLPRLLSHDAEPEDGSFPCMIMQRLPGRDIDDEYTHLTGDQKLAIARRLVQVQVQDAVASLSRASGYGFATSYQDGSLHSTWIDVPRSDLDRSRRRIEEVGAIDPIHVDRVEARLHKRASYFNSVPPEPFLDDTTTRNVIIHNGTLSGIVDADFVCFGDRLFTVALTRMSLLSRSFKTDYIDYWCRQLRLDQTQREALNLYTALFCVNFLGELGQQYNRASKLTVNEDKAAKLRVNPDDLLDSA